MCVSKLSQIRSETANVMSVAQSAIQRALPPLPDLSEGDQQGADGRQETYDGKEGSSLRSLP